MYSLTVLILYIKYSITITITHVIGQLLFFCVFTNRSVIFTDVNGK